MADTTKQPAKWTVLVPQELMDSIEQIPDVDAVPGRVVAVAPASGIYWKIAKRTDTDQGAELALEPVDPHEVTPGVSIPALTVLGAQQRHARGNKPLGGWDAPVGAAGAKRRRSPAS